jgi:hypothetical protein
MQTLTFIIFINLDITCQSVTGYFIGTFQWLKDRSYKLNGQFQIKLAIDSKSNLMSYTLDHYNKSYSNINLLNIYYYNGTKRYMDDGYVYKSKVTLLIFLVVIL